ncbi:MAG: hypothetical protein ACM3TR_08245 [Caulobacteraceae bacterium]
MAFYAPSGRMGKPKNIDDYDMYKNGDLLIYVERKTLEKANPSKEELEFLLEGYGWYKLKLKKSGG